MRSVRCDACGSRALVAASQCPKCGHLFEIRQDSGELLPLAYCSSCDSYYPERLGVCRWCGTTPDRAPIAPHVWKGVGVAGFVALAFGAWLVRDAPAGTDQPATRAASAPLTDSIATGSTITFADTVAPAIAAAAADTIALRTTAVSAGSIAGDSIPAPDTASVAPAGVEAPRAAPRRVAPSSPTARSTSKPKASPTSKSRRPTRWVRSVARSWVVVRAGASGSARIVASIGPNTRVQLGERRGQWMRVRAKGLSGWVDERAFFGGASSSRTRRGLAAR